MSEEIKKVHIRTYDEWLKYYKNATKEQIIEDLTRDVQYFADAVKDIKDLQQKVEQLENIRKEAIEYVYKHIQEYDADGTFTNLDEFDFIASPQALLNILNKGDNNGK